MRESLTIEEIPTTALIANPRNARTHSRQQIAKIAASIEEFGFTNPVLIDENAVLIAGHGRLAAARQLGLACVPAIRIRHLNAAQKRALALADNRIALDAGWDLEILAAELEALAVCDVDFDVEITGFETGEIDVLIGEEAEAIDAADEVPDADPEAAVVSRPGDLWLIGPHRLLCGDATDAAAYTRLMAGREAQMVFADPPYNVPIAGHVSGLGRVRHREFAMASGEMSAAAFTGFLVTTLGHHAAHSVDGAIHFVCMDWRHMDALLTAGRQVYAELKNLCVWTKTNAGMGSLYRSQHELVFVFKVGTGAHVNNVALGRHGRHRSNVWTYPGVNTFGADRAATLAMHPTVKPVRMVADAIRDCSRRGAIVLDGFAGSGTTLLAAARTGRIGYGIEIDPRYIDVALRRLAKHAGLDAVHAETGKSFTELAAMRATEPGASEDDAANDRTAERNRETG